MRAAPALAAGGANDLAGRRVRLARLALELAAAVRERAIESLKELLRTQL